MIKPVLQIDVMERLPQELAAALDADPYFCDIPIIQADDGNVIAEMQRKQSVITAKNGKRGIAVIVLQVIGDDESPDLLFGPLALYPAFEVIEQRELNRDPKTGTCKPIRKVCREIMRVIKPLNLPGFVEALLPDKPSIVPVPRSADENANLLRYNVNFKCYEAETDQVGSQIAAPDFTQNVPGTFALTCAMANAQIYYTLDDSFPSPKKMSADNATGTFLYAAGANIPVPPQGVIVRTRAYAPDLASLPFGDDTGDAGNWDTLIFNDVRDGTDSYPTNLTGTDYSGYDDSIIEGGVFHAPTLASFAYAPGPGGESGSSSTISLWFLKTQVLWTGEYVLITYIIMSDGSLVLDPDTPCAGTGTGDGVTPITIPVPDLATLPSDLYAGWNDSSGGWTSLPYGRMTKLITGYATCDDFLADHPEG